MNIQMNCLKHVKLLIQKEERLFLKLPFGDVHTVNKSSLISLKNVSIDSLCDPIANDTTESNHSEKALNRSKKRQNLFKSRVQQKCKVS
ncbi:hypothetical protein CEXT_388201 [Caerostris extrusa]|uniref:Ycf1 n=1 Tax=Caerostris extrusa TaxID=172846 RepID=A0AAV4VLV3_CAEEX|nr:hypothetical protein CEXT_388201 [Caerostris extrusa]